MHCAESHKCRVRFLSKILLLSHYYFKILLPNSLNLHEVQALGGSKIQEKQETRKIQPSHSLQTRELPLLSCPREISDVRRQTNETVVLENKDLGGKCPLQYVHIY